MHQPHNARIPAALALIALLGSEALAQSTQRSGAGPCRQGALAAIAMLDAGEEATPAFQDVVKALVETCGPVKRENEPAATGDRRAACRKLALAMLDAIEAGKMNTLAFARSRDAFGRTCGTR